MRLEELYKKDLAVESGQPIIQPHFFPTPNSKFITIHNSDKVPAKSYSYFGDVIKIIKPELESRGIKLYQVGASNDKELEGVDLFFNNTSFKQSFHIIKNSLCQIGIDSCPIHIASAFNIPTVSIYAHTYASTCDPLWNKDKAIILESHRNGNKPSFSLNEDPKTIDIILPEEIAEACFKALKFKKVKSQKTIYIGKKYLSKLVDIIPAEMPSQFQSSDSDVRVRMDIDFNEKILHSVLKLSSREIQIITDRPINLILLDGFKGKIGKIIYRTNSFNGEFLSFLKHSGINYELFLTDENRINEERSKFFDFDINFIDERKEAEELKKKYSDSLSGDLKVYSGRYYILGPKVFPTLGKDYNDIDFWLDSQYFRVYTDTIYDYGKETNN
jgi:hypothetical protein